MLALVVMAERARRNAGPRGDPAEHELVYRTYLANTAYVNNWDLVDISCKPIVGGYLLRRDRSPLYALARSDSLWERRIAMVGCQWFIKSGDCDDVYRLAELLLGDRHDLMHKAIGWSLRDAGRQDRDALRAFLDRHIAELPRTTLRYAIEHFDEPERQHYLNAALIRGAGGCPATSPSTDPARSGSADARRRTRPRSPSCCGSGPAAGRRGTSR